MVTDAENHSLKTTPPPWLYLPLLLLLSQRGGVLVSHKGKNGGVGEIKLKRKKKNSIIQGTEEFSHLISMSTDMSFLTGGVKWYKSVCTLSCSVMSDSCDPIDCSLLGFSVHGILQARSLKWVAISFSRESSPPTNQTHVSCIAVRLFTNSAKREEIWESCGRQLYWGHFWGRGRERIYLCVCVCVCVCVHALCHSVVSDSLQPLDCSPPGSYTHGIFQARILEWTAISYSRGSSWPRDRTHIFCISRQILYHCKESGNP